MSTVPQPNATNGGILPPTYESTVNCSSVSEYCPIPLTTYGYAPSLGANAFFAILFAICTIYNLYCGIRYKTRTFLIALVLGCFAETIGYIGRLILHNNAWSGNGFQIQICCLIIAPAFIAAGVYLMLKHVVIELGPQFSILRPRLYTWIFILADITSLVLQGAGGGIAATANNNSSLLDTGNNMMIAGIVWQVLTLLIFGTLVYLYSSRVYRHRSMLPDSAYRLLTTQRFKVFAAALVLAYSAIFIRCVYRIAEMAKGWRSPIMQDEAGFIVLDGLMVSVATVALTVCHPGYMFPEMQMHGNNVKGNGAKLESDAESGEAMGEKAGTQGGRKGPKGRFGKK